MVVEKELLKHESLFYFLLLMVDVVKGRGEGADSLRRARGTQPGQIRWDAGCGRRSHYTGLPPPGSARNGAQVSSV